MTSGVGVGPGTVGVGVTLGLGVGLGVGDGFSGPFGSLLGSGLGVSSASAGIVDPFFGDDPEGCLVAVVLAPAQIEDVLQTARIDVLSVTRHLDRQLVLDDPVAAAEAARDGYAGRHVPPSGAVAETCGLRLKAIEPVGTLLVAMVRAPVLELLERLRGQMTHGRTRAVRLERPCALQALAGIPGVLASSDGPTVVGAIRQLAEIGRGRGGIVATVVAAADPLVVVRRVLAVPQVLEVVPRGTVVLAVERHDVASVRTAPGVGQGRRMVDDLPIGVRVTRTSRAPPSGRIITTTSQSWGNDRADRHEGHHHRDESLLDPLGH